jgi:hypothetical protein
MVLKECATWPAEKNKDPRSRVKVLVGALEIKIPTLGLVFFHSWWDKLSCTKTLLTHLSKACCNDF